MRRSGLRKQSSPAIHHQAAPLSGPPCRPTKDEASDELPNEASTPAKGSAEHTTKRMRQRQMVEVFAGSGTLTKAFRRMGWSVLPVDVATNDVVATSTDLTNEDARNRLRATLRTAAVRFIHVGTPCASFSRARKSDGGPAPLRSSSCILGLPNLKSADQNKVVQGNLFADFSVKIALEAAEAGKLFSIENPASSRLWQYPCLLYTSDAADE